MQPESSPSDVTAGISDELINGPNGWFWSRPQLVEMLVCPLCRHRIVWQPSSGHCVMCGQVYPVLDGIPILLREPAAASHDEVEHDHARRRGEQHKRSQITYFDRNDAEVFEIDRPHGAPGLHRWQLERKFLIATDGLHALYGATALVVCGGSGMDAEFLARQGAKVITSDISLGAARRALERVRKFDLKLASIVADVETLPIPDRGVDIVYVHDGLHHLAIPEAGLTEMARVAHTAVVVTEPARALVTKIAVKLRLALEFEEAGNRVERLQLRPLAVALQAQGFAVQKGRRYAMFYRHQPGAVARAVSVPGVLPVAKLVSSLFIQTSGRFGNKLMIQAIRDPSAVHNFSV